MNNSIGSNNPAISLATSTGFAKPDEKLSRQQEDSIKPKDSFSPDSGHQNTGEIPSKAKFMAFPEDPYLDKPVSQEICSELAGKNLSGPQLRAQDKNSPIAIADPQGNFFYEVDDPRFNQVSSYAVSYRSLNIHQENAGYKLKWAFSGDQMNVNANAGEGANAYYSRWGRGISFLAFKSEGLEKVVHASQSSDIVSHETGHAVLDGLRPGFLSSWDPEARAYHESFADSTALLDTLKDDHNLEMLVKETGGDLRQMNRLSAVGEEFGAAIRLMNDDPADDHKTYIRDARNQFKYISPSELPDKAPDDQLSSGAHSFSRILTGAFYDAIEALFHQKAPQGSDSQQMKKALGESGHEMGRILTKSVDLSAPTGTNLRAMARCMLQADKLLNDGANNEMLSKIFQSRELITAQDIQEEKKLSALSREVILEKTPESQGEALDFLKEHQDRLGLDAGQYDKVTINTDKYGNRFIQFEGSLEINLTKETGIDHRGAEVFADVGRGVTLSFNSSGELAGVTADHADENKVSATINGLVKTHQEGLVRQQPLIKSQNLFKSRNIPYEAEIYQEPSGKFKMMRTPIIVD